jgi:hypothetical protein
MSDKQHVSELVAQGWEIVGFSTAHNTAYCIHTVLLRKQRQHKVVAISDRPLLGVAISELDI